MTNLILVSVISLILFYAIYDQFIMDRLKGKAVLSVVLRRQARLDGAILVGLILLSIYQGIQTGIAPFTLFLLASGILLTAYVAFIRSPRLLLKPQGFFLGNVYFRYKKIAQVNLAEQQVLVIDLNSGKRLFARIEKQADVDRVVEFFGGYQQHQSK